MSFKLAPDVRPHTIFHSGFYYSPGISIVTSNILGNNTLRVIPLWVPSTVTFDRIAVEITVAGNAGSVVRLGIYSDIGYNYPGSLILDAGVVAADTIGVKEIVISQTLMPGSYWIGAAVQLAGVTQPTLRTTGNPEGGFMLGMSTNVVSSTLILGYTDNAAGALPASFTANPSPITVTPRVLLRAA